MKMFILWFFAVLGFIFFLILIGVTYFVIADPFNLRPMMWMFLPGEQTERSILPTSKVGFNNNTSDLNNETVSNNLTSEQSAAMQSVGLEASTVANITSEQENCFINILGQARVNQVKSGAVPTASEFFSVRGCI